MCVCALLPDYMTNCSDSVVCCVRFSSDGKYLATGCNRTAQIYDTKTGLKTWWVFFRPIILFACTTRLLNLFFSHTTVFWRTTQLETCIYEVFVLALMASIWLLERTISRSGYVSSLFFSSFARFLFNN